MSDQQSGYPGAPPGWYDDPAGGPGQRWWDGYAWSEALVTRTPTTAPPPASPAPAWSVASARLASATTGNLVMSESAMVSIARIAVAVPALHYLVDLVVELADASQFRSAGRLLRVIYNDMAHNRTYPTFHETISLGPLSDVVLLFTLVSVIVACVWQNRAASAARALGLPATRSPAWGVGSWFVPIVNLWMPYQAIRDCLPPDDPNRQLVLRWWLILMGAWTTALGAEIAIYFSKPVAIGFAVPSALFAIGILATAPRVVVSIAAAHHTLLGGQASAPRPAD
jgi:hypothetical protein